MGYLHTCAFDNEASGSIHNRYHCKSFNHHNSKPLVLNPGYSGFEGTIFMKTVGVSSRSIRLCKAEG